MHSRGNVTQCAHRNVHTTLVYGVIYYPAVWSPVVVVSEYGVADCRQAPTVQSGALALELFGCNSGAKFPHPELFVATLINWENEPNVYRR